MDVYWRSAVGTDAPALRASSHLPRRGLLRHEREHWGGDRRDLQRHHSAAGGRGRQGNSISNNTLYNTYQTKLVGEKAKSKLKGVKKRKIYKKEATRKK